MKRNIAWKALAATGVAALALTGCGSGNTAPKVAKGATGLVGYTTVPASQVQQGGTLNLATPYIPTSVGNWNGDTSEGAEGDAWNVESPAACAMIVGTANGGWKVDPDYASSLKLVSTSPQVVEAKLNPKAVWQDGSPITATDYKATFAALSGKSSKYDLASSAGYNDISSFDIVSPTDFKITFAKPYADWASLFGGDPSTVLPANVANDPQLWNRGYTNKPLPSCGPFVATKVDNSAKVVDYKPNPKWWGTKPKLSEITFTEMNDSTQAQAYVNNEVDAVEVDQDVDGYRTAKAKPDSKVMRSAGLTWSQLTFNGTKWPLNDQAVRQAISHAFNRKLVAETANAPVGYPAQTQGSFIFMPGQAGYTDVVDKNLGYSPAKAKALLKGDGWTLAGGKWTKGGKTLTLSITITPSSSTEKQRAELFQNSLAAIDIPVHITNVPDADLFPDIMGGNYQVCTFSWGGTAFPISSSESLFYPAGRPGGNGQNFSFITDPSLGGLWNQANVQLDPAKRLKIAEQIDQKLSQLVTMLPIAPAPLVVIANKNLANYGPSMFLSHDWTTIGFTSSASS